jgi:zinc protease
LKNQPVDDIYLTKVKQTQLREREVALERNDFWISAMDSSRWNADDLGALILEFPKRVEALSREDIQNAARKYFGTPNVSTFILKPEPTKPSPAP